MNVEQHRELDGMWEKSQKWGMEEALLPTAAHGQVGVRSSGTPSFQRMIRVIWGKKKKESILLCDTEKGNSPGGCCWWQEKLWVEFCTHSSPQKRGSDD